MGSLRDQFRATQDTNFWSTNAEFKETHHANAEDSIILYWFSDTQSFRGISLMIVELSKNKLMFKHLKNSLHADGSQTLNNPSVWICRTENKFCETIDSRTNRNASINWNWKVSRYVLRSWVQIPVGHIFF